MRLEALRQRPRRRLISLTPLIDVVFILLVFFMLASSFSQWRVVDLVVGGEGTAADDRQVAQVRLTTEGARFEGEPLDSASLIQRLDALAPDAIRVEVDPEVALQPALDLMLELRAIDGAAVSLSGDEG